MPAPTVEEFGRQLRKKYAHVDQIARERAFARNLAGWVRRRLKRLRTQAGLKQEDLASSLGVDQSWVSRFETQDEADLSLQSVVRYARACGLKPAIVFLPGDPEQGGEAEMFSLVEGVLIQTGVDVREILESAHEKSPDMAAMIETSLTSAATGMHTVSRLTGLIKSE